MAIFQAPMADQPMIQPAMTVIIAQVGMGGMCSAPGPGPMWVPPASAAGPGRPQRGNASCRGEFFAGLMQFQTQAPTGLHTAP